MMDDKKETQEKGYEKSALETVKTIFRLKIEKATTITAYLCMLVIMMLISLAVGIYLLTLPVNI